jgi:hypothetical protein
MNIVCASHVSHAARTCAPSAVIVYGCVVVKRTPTIGCKPSHETAGSGSYEPEPTVALSNSIRGIAGESGVTESTLASIIAACSAASGGAGGSPAEQAAQQSRASRRMIEG